MKIIGILLLKNEEIWIKNIIENIVDFCDKVIVLDNNSSDKTWSIIQKIQVKYSNIFSRKIDSVGESHSFISEYAGTDTWIFGVDGDELYDPTGLVKLKKDLIEGRFKGVWNIKGNVLHCTNINKIQKNAVGYLAPPSRSMTKLYNFNLIESWDNCPERLHAGNLIQKKGVNLTTKYLYNNYDWNNTYFKCLHLCFIKRSSNKIKSNLNPAEIMDYSKKLLYRIISKANNNFVTELMVSFQQSMYKTSEYAKGELVKVNIEKFI
jgi:glycosyltransferase involved in cell wall biosynthesis